MLIEIRVARANIRRFHQFLAERLRRKFIGSTVWIETVDGEPPWCGAIEALLSLERIVLHRSQEAMSDVLTAANLAPPPSPGRRADVIIDCSGLEPRHPDGQSGVLLRPLYAGLASSHALVANLLAGSLPEVAIEDVAAGRIVAFGRPGGGAAGLGGGIEAVLSRMALLIEAAIRTPLAYEPSTARHRPAPTAQRALAFVLRNLAADCARAVFHLCFHTPHWRVGWRMHDGPGVLERGNLGGPRWHVLPDSGRSFYADPFPVRWQGRTFVFVEELEHRVGKGFIAAIEFGPDGPIGEAIPVLVEPWHLSYPFIMEHAGALYMVPEASLSHVIALYRCTLFPHRWERVATLVDRVEAADCTFFRHDGLFWMMSATRENLGGYSDTLAIHYADDLLGPWTEHALRPALLDVAASRPAGRVVHKDGRLWRPVQDCSSGYGKVLGLAEIDKLDRESFSQVLRTRIAPGPAWPGRRLHTLNREGRLECIDGAIHNPKLSWARDIMAAKISPAEVADA